MLEARGAALVWADVHESPVCPLWRTAPLGYLRLHGGSAQIWPHYTSEWLRAWVERLAAAWRDDEDAFVYFNNDGRGAAVENASVFAYHVRDLGRSVSRTPGGP